MMHATGHMYPTGMGQGMEMDPEVLKMAMEAVTLNTVMGIHAFFSVIVGTLLVILPHTLFHDMSGAYSFLAHEVIRCYGAVTIGLGYMAYKLRYIKDGRIRRLLAETYFVVYGVTTISLWKAWISNPSHHTLWALTLIALSTFATFFYGYFRFLRPIKTFQLPGAGKGNL
jgi:hypothetical protein